MRKQKSRGLFLQQYKEPAVSGPIEKIGRVKTVYLPISNRLCVNAAEKVTVGQLVSYGQRPETVDSFASIFGTAVAVGSFDCEKFIGQQFLQIDALPQPPEQEALPEDGVPSDEDIQYAARRCGVINHTDKRTLEELCDDYPNGVRTLVIDAVDDEPYVSSKTVLLFQRGEQIAAAIHAINRIFCARQIRIDVYDRGEAWTDRLPQRLEGISVHRVREPYPVSKRMICDEQTAYLDVSALLCFYYSALAHRPYTQTVVTVAGDCVQHSCNIEVPVGTPIGDILAYCGLKQQPGVVVLGGSMTGYAVNTTDIPVLQSTKAILALSSHPAFETTECIGCGRCIDVCPEKLLPYYIYQYTLDNNIEKLYHLSADRCTECGCCSYICPAKIDLRQVVKKSRRALLKEMWQNESDGQN